MLSKSYHVNQEGNVGVCKAKKACPFMATDDHFKNANDARAYFESVMEGRIDPPLDWLLTTEDTVSPLPNPDAALKSLYSEFQTALKPYGAAHPALDWYKKAGYEDMNTYLRSGVKGNETLELRAKRLDDLIAGYEADTSPVRKLYRVITTDMDPAAYAKALDSEGTYSDPAFMSTSLSPEFPASIAAGNYAHWKGNRVVFEIVTKGGLPCPSYDKWDIENYGSKESEVLLARGKKFRVAGVGEKTFEFGEFLDHCEGDWRDEIKGRNNFTCTVVQLVEDLD